MFTSGTTGNPKGAVMTHRNLISCLDSCITMNAQDFEPFCPELAPYLRGEKKSRGLSWLPLAHIAGRLGFF